MKTERDGGERSLPRARTIAMIGLAIVVVSAVLVYRERLRDSLSSTTESSELASDLDSGGADRESKHSIEPAGSSSMESRLSLDQAVAAFEKAQVRHTATQSAVTAALSGMAESERQLEDLERFVEELETRGEDPAEHAEEGMKRFNPAFETYERAVQELERAESEEAIERIKLLGAEQEMEAARRRAALESSTR